MVQFSKCAAENGGSLSASACASLRINGSIFSNSSASANGGSIHIETATVLIQNSTILSSHAVQGGGIYAQSSKLVVLSSNFVQNSAVLGGGLFWRCSGENSCLQSQIARHTQFRLNSATGGACVCEGGSASIVPQWPDLNTTSPIENHAAYGPLYASLPHSLVPTLIGSGVWSGTTVSESHARLVVRVFDRFGQIVKRHSGNSVITSIHAHTHTSTSGPVQSVAGNSANFDCERGSADFGQLLLNAHNNGSAYNVVATFSSTAVCNLGSATPSAGSLKMLLRGCQFGSVPPQSEFGKCDVCPVGKYALTKMTACEECRIGAVCQDRGIYNRAGWWNAALSTAFYKCLKPAMCIAGLEKLDDARRSLSHKVPSQLLSIPHKTTQY